MLGFRDRIMNKTNTTAILLEFIIWQEEMFLSKCDTSKYKMTNTAVKEGSTGPRQRLPWGNDS